MQTTRFLRNESVDRSVEIGVRRDDAAAVADFDAAVALFEDLGQGAVASQ